MTLLQIITAFHLVSTVIGYTVLVTTATDQKCISDDRSPVYPVYDLTINFTTPSQLKIEKTWLDEWDIAGYQVTPDDWSDSRMSYQKCFKRKNNETDIAFRISVLARSISFRVPLEDGSKFDGMLVELDAPPSSTCLIKLCYSFADSSSCKNTTEKSIKMLDDGKMWAHLLFRVNYTKTHVAIDVIKLGTDLRISYTHEISNIQLKLPSIAVKSLRGKAAFVLHNNIRLVPMEDRNTVLMSVAVLRNDTQYCKLIHWGAEKPRGYVQFSSDAKNGKYARYSETKLVSGTTTELKQDLWSVTFKIAAIVKSNSTITSIRDCVDNISNESENSYQVVRIREGLIAVGCQTFSAQQIGETTTRKADRTQAITISLNKTEMNHLRLLAAESKNENCTEFEICDNEKCYLIPAKGNVIKVFHNKRMCHDITILLSSIVSVFWVIWVLFLSTLVLAYADSY